MSKGILSRLKRAGLKGNKSFFRHSLRELMDSCQEVMNQGHCMVVIYIDIIDFQKIEQGSGEFIAQRVLDYMQRLLSEKTSGIMPSEDIVTIDRLLGDDFVLIYRISGGDIKEQVQNFMVALRILIKESLNRTFFKELGQMLDVHIGYSVINPRDNRAVENKVYAALREAQTIARGRLDAKSTKLLEEFKDIVENQRLNIVYQPIVSLHTGVILGWEALTRGPLDSYFRSPDVIFNFAQQVDMLYTTERVCRRLAISRLNKLGDEQKLFLNINPMTINDPNFVRGETVQLLRESGLKQSNIVFEITEQINYSNLPHFQRSLEHYRGQGYLVAVDDVGSGFSSLAAIAQVRPDFLKMDMSLIRDVDSNPVKKALMETFVTFSQKIGCKIVAEGIENERELQALIKMGVHYGQGFYLARPDSPKPMPSSRVCLSISQESGRNRQVTWRHSVPVGDIVEYAVCVKKNVPVERVKGILDANLPLSGVVVVEDEKPVGLLMRHNMHSYLCSQYGVALYSSRPVEIVMDRNPLVVDAQTPIETVSQVAMSRDKTKLYDYIIITRQGKYDGVVSVQNLLDTITRIQMEFARGANPLTGLPGNNAIEEEIDTRLQGGAPFTLVYLDLDHFKSYNDKYGFESGDRVILFTGKLLRAVVDKYGSGGGFVGHIGGDDFVLIVESSRVDIICQRIIRYFDRLIGSYYSGDDRIQGGIEGHDRSGNQKWYPFISVSMSVVECGHPDKINPGRIAEVAAELKQYAKNIQGSVYVRDRRTGGRH